jgi:hypothetical protein
LPAALAFYRVSLVVPAAASVPDDPSALRLLELCEADRTFFLGSFSLSLLVTLLPADNNIILDHDA